MKISGAFSLLWAVAAAQNAHNLIMKVNGGFLGTFLQNNAYGEARIVSLPNAPARNTIRFLSNPGSTWGTIELRGRPLVIGNWPKSSLYGARSGGKGTIFQLVEKNGVKMMRSGANCIIYDPTMKEFTVGSCDLTNSVTDKNYVGIDCQGCVAPVKI